VLGQCRLAKLRNVKCGRIVVVVMHAMGHGEVSIPEADLDCCVVHFFIEELQLEV